MTGSAGWALSIDMQTVVSKTYAPWSRHLLKRHRFLCGWMLIPATVAIELRGSLVQKLSRNFCISNRFWEKECQLAELEEKRFVICLQKIWHPSASWGSQFIVHLAKTHVSRTIRRKFWMRGQAVWLWANKTTRLKASRWREVFAQVWPQNVSAMRSYHL